MKAIQKTTFIVILISLFFPLQAAETPRFSGSLGLTPNTMGTTGQEARIDYTPFSFLGLGVRFTHDVVFHHDLEFEGLGGPLYGDIYKDILAGEVTVAGRFNLGGIVLEPFAGFAVSLTEADSMAGILYEGDVENVPRDIEAFIDIDEDERLSGFLAGGRLKASPGPFSISIEGDYAPMLITHMAGGYLQNYLDWPVSDTAYPAFAEYWWKEHDYELDGSGSQYRLGVRLGFNLPSPSLRIVGFGKYRQFTYDGSSVTENNFYTPYRTDSTAETTIIQTANNSLIQVDVSERNLEGGLSCALEFVETSFGLPGYPVIDISYVRTFREVELDHIEDENNKESWIEDYDFARFSIYWDL